MPGRRKKMSVITFSCKLRKIFYIFLILLTASIGSAATYYVSASKGNDQNTGLSPEKAWKTISKVNKSRFYPGDFILFKKDEIWREQLKVPSSGSENKSITFGAYGHGRKPIISGAKIVSGWKIHSKNIYKMKFLYIYSYNKMLI